MNIEWIDFDCRSIISKIYCFSFIFSNLCFILIISERFYKHMIKAILETTGEMLLLYSFCHLNVLFIKTKCVSFYRLLYNLLMLVINVILYEINHKTFHRHLSNLFIFSQKLCSHQSWHASV